MPRERRLWGEAAAGYLSSGSNGYKYGIVELFLVGELLWLGKLIWQIDLI